MTVPFMQNCQVALFTRAWIEMMSLEKATDLTVVALFTRAWIEIMTNAQKEAQKYVALFTRAWIEIFSKYLIAKSL